MPETHYQSIYPTSDISRMKYPSFFAFFIILSTSFLSCAAQLEVDPPHEDEPTIINNKTIESGDDVRRLLQSESGWVRNTLAKMTLEEKVAQLMSPRVNSYYLSHDSDQYKQMLHYVEELKVGGLTFFQGNIFELASYTNDMQQRAEIPLLISSDYERGVAMRINRATLFPVNMALGATRDETLSYRVGKAIAREGRALGVHQNFAPVLDINNNPGNPVINVRSFGEDPELVSDMGLSYMRGLHDGGMISTGKHFPGHGDTNADSHINLPVIPYNMDRLSEIELIPFRHTIDNGLMSVMSAHITLPKLTEEKGTPATLSNRVMTTLLREEMGFSGIIVTDAMDMHGISANYASGEAAVLAIKAGVDMILLPPNPREAIDAVVAAVEIGEISHERIDQSVIKILSAKEWSGLDESRFIDMNKIRPIVANREHQDLSREVARRSMTLVRNKDDVLPLNPRGRKKVLIISITDREDQMMLPTRAEYGLPYHPTGNYFTELFRREYGNIEVMKLDPRSNQQEIESLLVKAKKADVIIGASYILSRSGAGSIGIPEDNMKALRQIALMDKPFILTSFGDPYFISTVPGVQAYLCAYSDSEAAIEAAIQTIFGKNNPLGTLPVTIPGYGDFDQGLNYK
ncbi:MAG: glycoside hydrolase family 3 N-terminal domain-containing protein [Balneolales bacterium]